MGPRGSSAASVVAAHQAVRECPDGKLGLWGVLVSKEVILDKCPARASSRAW